jgi:hypothetical protein
MKPRTNGHTPIHMHTQILKLQQSTRPAAWAQAMPSIRPLIRLRTKTPPCRPPVPIRPASTVIAKSVAHTSWRHAPWRHPPPWRGPPPRGDSPKEGEPPPVAKQAGKVIVPSQQPKAVWKEGLLQQVRREGSTTTSSSDSLSPSRSPSTYIRSKPGPWQQPASPSHGPSTSSSSRRQAPSCYLEQPASPCPRPRSSRSAQQPPVGESSSLQAQQISASIGASASSTLARPRRPLPIPLRRPAPLAAGLDATPPATLSSIDPAATGPSTASRSRSRSRRRRCKRMLSSSSSNSHASYSSGASRITPQLQSDIPAFELTLDQPAMPVDSQLAVPSPVTPIECCRGDPFFAGFSPNWD